MSKQKERLAETKRQLAKKGITTWQRLCSLQLSGSMSSMLDSLIFTLPLIASAGILACHWRRGFVVTVGVFAPGVLAFLLAQASNYPAFVALVACVFVLPIAAGFVEFVEWRGMSTLAHLVVANTSLAVVGICCILPVFVAWTRAGPPPFLCLLFFIGAAGVIPTYAAHELANRLPSAPTHRFQLSLLRLFLITTLAATLVVFPVAVGTTLWFFGAAIYWGGCGLVPVPEDYRKRYRKRNAEQRITAVFAILIGLSFMLLGLTSAAAGAY